MMHDISIISLVLTAALSLGCLFLILSPFFKWDSFLQTSGEDLASTKESLLSTLNELEFEYKMDKLSHSDYKSLKKQYEEQVALILKQEEEEQISAAGVDKDIMEEVEKEIEAEMKSYRNKKGEGK